MIGPYTFAHGENVVCPHCAQGVRLLPTTLLFLPNKNQGINTDRYGVAVGGGWESPGVAISKCPLCEQTIIEAYVENEARLILPRVPNRGALHESVPEILKKDYKEALLVLVDSPNASAALSRRCLQALLTEQGATQGRLIDQINAKYEEFPPYLKNLVDHIRRLGNIAVHTKQDKATAEIIDIQEGEAIWMIKVLEQLFEFYYAMPADTAAQVQQIEAKYGRVGKHTAETPE